MADGATASQPRELVGEELDADLLVLGGVPTHPSSPTRFYRGAFMRGLTSMPDEDQKVDLPRLAGLPFFHGMPQWALVRIAQSATELSVPAGHVLVRQYDRATAVFVLLSGTVQILVRVGSDDLLVGVLRGEGELVGWSTFRPPYRYTASVRCEEPTVVVRVPATVFEELFAQDPAFAYATLSRVAVSVAERFELARDLLTARPRRGPVGGNAHEQTR